MISVFTSKFAHSPKEDSNRHVLLAGLILEVSTQLVVMVLCV